MRIVSRQSGSVHLWSTCAKSAFSSAIVGFRLLTIEFVKGERRGNMRREKVGRKEGRERKEGNGVGVEGVK